MFLCDVARQKLLKLANVSRSYSKNNTGTVFFRHGVQLMKENVQTLIRHSHSHSSSASSTNWHVSITGADVSHTASAHRTMTIARLFNSRVMSRNLLPRTESCMSLDNVRLTSSQCDRSSTLFLFRYEYFKCCGRPPLLLWLWPPKVTNL